MISSNRDSIIIGCDDCDDERQWFECEFDICLDFSKELDVATAKLEVLQAMCKEGWRMRKNQHGVWKHSCPRCTAFF